MTSARLFLIFLKIFKSVPFPSPIFLMFTEATTMVCYVGRKLLCNNMIFTYIHLSFAKFMAQLSFPNAISRRSLSISIVQMDIDNSLL
jgi:hypothetical protein